VARYFLQKGYPKVYAIKGGWNAWKEAELPVEKK
jgi:rhodanese-related sulfurtransferase